MNLLKAFKIFYLEICFKMGYARLEQLITKFNSPDTFMLCVCHYYILLMLLDMKHAEGRKKDLRSSCSLCAPCAVILFHLNDPTASRRPATQTSIYFNLSTHSRYHLLAHKIYRTLLVMVSPLALTSGVPDSNVGSKTNCPVYDSGNFHQPLRNKWGGGSSDFLNVCGNR
jgi:hypothetical protein